MSGINVMGEQGQNEFILKRKPDFPSDITNADTKMCKKSNEDLVHEESKSVMNVKGKHRMSGEHIKDSDTVIKELLDEIKVSEERLRKLKMTKMYREKNNLEELERLIQKWRDVSQQALGDLLELLPSPQPSLTELVKHLQIDSALVHFNQEDGVFL